MLVIVFVFPCLVTAEQPFRVKVMAGQTIRPLVEKQHNIDVQNNTLTMAQVCRSSVIHVLLISCKESHGVHEYMYDCVMCMFVSYLVRVVVYYVQCV